MSDPKLEPIRVILERMEGRLERMDDRQRNMEISAERREAISKHNADGIDAMRTSLAAHIKEDDVRWEKREKEQEQLESQVRQLDKDVAMLRTRWVWVAGGLGTLGAAIGGLIVHLLESGLT